MKSVTEHAFKEKDKDIQNLVSIIKGLLPTIKQRLIELSQLDKSSEYIELLNYLNNPNTNSYIYRASLKFFDKNNEILQSKIKIETSEHEDKTKKVNLPFPVDFMPNEADEKNSTSSTDNFDPESTVNSVRPVREFFITDNSIEVTPEFHFAIRELVTTTATFFNQMEDFINIGLPYFKKILTESDYNEVDKLKLTFSSFSNKATNTLSVLSEAIDRKKTPAEQINILINAVFYNSGFRQHLTFLVDAIKHGNSIRTTCRHYTCREETMDESEKVFFEGNALLKLDSILILPAQRLARYALTIAVICDQIKVKSNDNITGDKIENLKKKISNLVTLGNSMLDCETTMNDSEILNASNTMLSQFPTAQDLFSNSFKSDFFTPTVSTVNTDPVNVTSNENRDENKEEMTLEI